MGENFKVMKWNGEKFIVDHEDEKWPLGKYYFVFNKITKGDKVLDVACGRGFGTFLLSQKAKEIIGLDIDQPSIEEAKTNFNGENLNFLLGDGRKMKFPDNYFDAVVSIETIEHLNEEDQVEFINEIKRVLKPNGRLFLSTPDRYVVAKQGMAYGAFHEKEFTKEELINFLDKNGFFDLELYGQGKFSEPGLLRDFLNFLKSLDILKLRKRILFKKIVQKLDRATSPIKFDYEVFKMDANELASHVIVICNNKKS